MIEIKTFVFNPFQENTYVLSDETKECIIIDCGCYEDHERMQLQDYIKENDLKPVAILNTHSHVDHILGNQWIKEVFNIPLKASMKDEALLATAVSHGKMYGMILDEPPVIDEDIDESKTVKFGSSELKILDVPGHSPGCIAFYNDEQKFVFSGDVLFCGSIGRTDLPGGDYDQIMSSIMDKLTTLDDDYKVYAGHGPSTTIGIERKSNPFLSQ
ncbi:MAG: MBL fold metallo-hydrolase [Bacteroidales bacterium]|jgi:glyoxylase-like metal-dependent hydrolase (beta-lactamase superfamily II)|nr:MBL fold metallo-hydrolase [Bacteroidales bacterium]